jgi:hypothetical protein
VPVKSGLCSAAFFILLQDSRSSTLGHRMERQNLPTDTDVFILEAGKAVYLEHIVHRYEEE